MRVRFARPVTALAVLYASITVATTSPPAQALTESTMVLVASQYGGATCANNQRVIVANPFTGAKISGVVEPGTPETTFGNINEAKPYANNRKVVALWGGSNTTTSRAGVGVYDLDLDQWTTEFFLPTTWEVGANSAHSITVLPDGYFAIAQTGSIGGVGSGYVVIVSPSGTVGQRLDLTSAHGIEYDPRNGGHVYAVGSTKLRKYTYSTSSKTLTQVAEYTLPTSGGHDLRRRRQDDNYSVTTNTGTHVFKPEGPGGDFWDDLKMDNGATISGAKSVDQRFDGLVEFNWFDSTGSDPTDEFVFLDGTQVEQQFCTNFYKAGRWLYQPGVPDFNDGGGGGGQETWSPTFTVGAGANNWWIEIYASADVVSLDVIGKNGQFFMSNVTKQVWGAFAQSPPQEMPAGSLIKLIGRKADGSSAGSITFPWLQDTNPDTEAGWNASFAVTQCASTLKATISSAAVAAKVRIGTADWAVMTKNTSTGQWERAGGVPVGTKYLMRAYLSPGDETAAQAYDVIRTC